METLRERANGSVRIREQWLMEAKQALRLIEQLPTELQEIEATSADMNTGTLYISFKFNPEIVDLLKRLGVYDLTYVASSFNGNWQLNGEYDLPDKTEVKISVQDAETPPHCRIEKFDKLETVTRYRAICEDEGKEITQTTKV